MLLSLFARNIHFAQRITLNSVSPSFGIKRVLLALTICFVSAQHRKTFQIFHNHFIVRQSQRSINTNRPMSTRCGLVFDIFNRANLNGLFQAINKYISLGTPDNYFGVHFEGGQDL